MIMVDCTKRLQCTRLHILVQCTTSARSQGKGLTLSLILGQQLWKVSGDPLQFLSNRLDVLHLIVEGAVCTLCHALYRLQSAFDPGHVLDAAQYEVPVDNRYRRLGESQLKS